MEFVNSSQVEIMLLKCIHWTLLRNTLHDLGLTVGICRKVLRSKKTLRHSSKHQAALWCTYISLVGFLLSDLLVRCV